MIVKVWLRQGHRSRAETQAIRSFNCRTSLQQLHLLEQSHQWQIRGNTVWRWKQTLRKVVQFVSQLNGGSNEFEQYFEIVSALNWIYYIYIYESSADCGIWGWHVACCYYAFLHRSDLASGWLNSRLHLRSSIAPTWNLPSGPSRDTSKLDCRGCQILSLALPVEDFPTFSSLLSGH